MRSTAPTYSVTSQNSPREVHYALGGMVDPETLRTIQIELYRTARVWIESGLKFRVLGDMRESLPQTQEVAELFRITQEESVKLGMEKLAILYDKMLTKLQFERISGTVEMAFFKDRDEALEWLRS